MEPSNDVERRIALHPYFQKDRLLLATRPPLRLLALVSLFILVESESVWSQAPSGSGKTPTLRIILSRLRQRMEETEIVYFNMGRLLETNSKTFPYRFAIAVGVEQPSGLPGKLRTQVDRRMALRAMASPFRKFIVGIDEAQMLRKADFNFLKDSANALGERGCSLMTIMFGEGPLLGRNVRELMSDEESKGLVQRFARRELAFPYYESLEDIHSLCHELDTCGIPELGGQSVMQNVLPKAWASGLRLANHAASLWDALDNVRSPAGRVFKTARSAVLLMMDKDGAGFIPKASLFTKAARSAGESK